MSPAARRGFTLIELAVVTAILGAMAMMLLPLLSERIEAARIDSERQQSALLVDDIKRSFRETDWSRNVAALPGTVPSGVRPTLFWSSATVASGTEWSVKVGRLRGIVPILEQAVNQDQQQGLYRISHNALGRERALIAGPSEPGQQRYLLISLVAPESKGLIVPEYDGSRGWFDAVWNNDWEDAGATLPPEWSTHLNEKQVAAWLKGRGASTNVHHLVVQRIVQPKHRVIVNNTHSSYSAWLDFNGSSSALSSSPGDGVQTSPEILSGRQIVVRRGVTAPGTEAYRFYLSEETSVSVQP